MTEAKVVDQTEVSGTQRRPTITKSVVEALSPGTRDVYLWDGKLPGFGVKITPKGSRIYVVKYWLAGRAGWYTIGAHGTFTAEEARREAKRIKGEVAAGRDPQQTKRASRAEIEARRQAEAPGTDTFEAVLDEFIRRDQRPRCSTWNETDRRLRTHVLPRWKGRDVRTITRKDVIRLVDELRDAGLGGGGNRVLSALRRMFNWAVDREIIEVSPVARVNPVVPDHERERVLNDSELRAIWLATERVGYPFGSLVQLLLATAQRRSEVARMRWSDVDSDNRIWRIPPTETKANRAHDVPLSTLAVAILAEMPRGERGDFVLSTTKGQLPISGFSKSKQRLVQMLSGLHAEGLTDVVPVDWWLHDLRRTAATGMARDGIPVSTIAKVLNHAEGGVTRLYDRHSYLVEKQRALNAWGMVLSETVGVSRTIGPFPNVHA